MIINQSQSSLELELAIEQEARSHKEQNEAAIELSELEGSNEEEQDGEEREEGTSLMVSPKLKAPSPSYSLLLIADQLGLCQASEMQAREGDMESCFDGAFFFLTLMLVVVILAGRTPTKSYLLGALLSLPRVVQAVPWQSLMPIQPEEAASYLIKGSFTLAPPPLG